MASIQGGGKPHPYILATRGLKRETGGVSYEWFIGVSTVYMPAGVSWVARPRCFAIGASRA